MWGAIIGDIVGSPYEFDDTAIKTTQFELFSEDSVFTDDTVMTVAVGQALLEVRQAASGKLVDEAKGEAAVIAAMRRWGRRYPCGYGARFRHWLVMDTPKPYDSCGNGSAMRVAAVGWLCHSPEQVCRWASVTARVTHNHPEGIKGAAATALAIYLARTGATKAQIKAQIEKRFDYDLSRSLDQIRPGYRRFETCQATVPEAITAFLESTGFEDTVRLAVSLGGDSDTLAAIAGSIAQAAYGIPSDLVDQARRRLDQPLLEVIEAFDQVVSDAPQPPVI